MKKPWLFSVVAAVLVSLSVSFALAKKSSSSFTPSKELATMISLAGHWEGKGGDMPGSEEKVEADYKVTSGGSAVVETLFPGTPHEMTSIYSDDNGHLTMTHYCMLHNHPKMELSSAKDGELNFVLAKNGNVDPKSTHMHALTVSIVSPNEIKHQWTLYEDGRRKNDAQFTFTRKS